jgi:acid stress chaperone HdeB
VKAIAAALIACNLGTSSAPAQPIDLATLKCREFIDSGKQTVASIVMWLDGYYTDEEDPTVLDFDKMKATTEKLSAFCLQNPSMGLMNAAENVLGK